MDIFYFLMYSIRLIKIIAEIPRSYLINFLIVKNIENLNSLLIEKNKGNII